MEPATVAIILAVVGIIGAGVANLRFRSRCHNETLGLDLSISKRFNQDLARTKPPMRTTSDDEEEYSI